MKSDSKANQLQLSYGGNEFLLDVAEGNLVSLTKLHEIVGSPKNKDPRFWRRNPEAKRLFEALAYKLNVRESHIIKSKRGKQGGTYAHWQLALAYAKYLSPEFHLIVNSVFRERLEEALDPELGINRSKNRAVSAWQRQGKPQDWIEERLNGVQNRNHFTATLKAHSVTGNGYGWATNAIYKPILGGTAPEIKKARGIPVKGNIRDTVSRVELAALSLSEAIASENIEDKDYHGNRLCAVAAGRAGQAVRLALDHSKKAP